MLAADGPIRPTGARAGRVQDDARRAGDFGARHRRHPRSEPKPVTVRSRDPGLSPGDHPYGRTAVRSAL